MTIAKKRIFQGSSMHYHEIAVAIPSSPKSTAGSTENCIDVGPEPLLKARMEASEKSAISWGCSRGKCDRFIGYCNLVGGCSLAQTARGRAGTPATDDLHIPPPRHTPNIAWLNKREGGTQNDL